MVGDKIKVEFYNFNDFQNSKENSRVVYLA